MSISQYPSGSSGNLPAPFLKKYLGTSFHSSGSSWAELQGNPVSSKTFIQKYDMPSLLHPDVLNSVKDFAPESYATWSGNVSKVGSLVGGAIIGTGYSTVARYPSGSFMRTNNLGQGDLAIGPGLGDGTFVQIEDYILKTSSNGKTWTDRGVKSAFNYNKIYRVIFGNGTFVAAGASGTVATSTDGINWTNRTSGFGSTAIKNVFFENGNFIAFASGKIGVSADGINWTVSSISSLDADAAQIAYGNGTYVLTGGSNSAVFYSTDLVSWNSISSLTSQSVYAVAYGNNKFVSISLYGPSKVYTSTDGVNWLEVTTLSANLILYPRGLQFLDGKFITYGSGSSYENIIASEDGITWNSVGRMWTSLGIARAKTIKYGETYYRYFGNEVNITTDIFSFAMPIALSCYAAEL